MPSLPEFRFPQSTVTAGCLSSIGFTAGHKDPGLSCGPADGRATRQRRTRVLAPEATQWRAFAAPLAPFYRPSRTRVMCLPAASHSGSPAGR